MDNDSKSSKKKRNNPNIFSNMFFWWIWPVLVTGNRRDVEEDDLLIPPRSYDADKLGSYLEKHWFDECERAINEHRDPKLWKALCRGFWQSYMQSAVYISIQTALRTYQPIIFAKLLSYWSVDSSMSRLDAGLYALAILAIIFINMLCQHHNILFVNRFGLKIKVACSSLLYRKVLRMSQIALGDVTGGKLVNLLSNDMARFDYAFTLLHYLWVVPLQLIVVLYLLYHTGGWASPIGFIVVVILILPLQALITQLTTVFRRDTAQRTDKRIKLMSEIITGIQVIKMYAWEKPIQLVVRAARAYELNSLKKALFVRSVFIGFLLITERAILFVTCLALVLSGTNVTATVIYPLQQFIALIQLNLTMIVPLSIASLSEMLVSLDRIQTILVMDERDDQAALPMLKAKKGVNGCSTKFEKTLTLKETSIVVHKEFGQTNEVADISDELTSRRPSAADVEYPIELYKASASWTGSKNPSEQFLKNISLRLRKGKLCAVIGPVGSGKSSLLQVLLKELPVNHGHLNIKGKVSYAAQAPWLFPGTVRENILFELPYDTKKYDEVCRVCCLLPDFKQFPYGDLSLVGERGVSLSGGQKARINLARAVYREADIYLLDDPLSAVDANVGRMLFEGCIMGYLRERTTVLVTHQVHYLKAADLIVVLNEGAVETMGDYEELIKSGKEFSKLLECQESKCPDAKNPEGPSSQRRVSKTSNKGEDGLQTRRKQTQEAEERVKGSLKFDVLWQYFKSVNSWFVVSLTMATLVIAQGAGTAADYWLGYWTNAVDAYKLHLPPGQNQDTNSDTQMGIFTTEEYLIVYGSMVLGVIVLSQVRILAYVKMATRASANLHDTIFSKLIITIMKFFDNNSSGRVLNRFSKDIGAVDEFFPRSLLETVQMYLSMASVLILNAISLPWTLIPTVFLLVIFIFYIKWYLNAAQAVKRLEGTTKSPVFGMINSTISGLTTIRSCNSGERLLKHFDNAQNLNSSAFYTFIGGTNAFAFYLDALCLVYLGVVIALFLLVDFSSLIPVGSVGLAVSQSTALTLLLQIASRNSTEFLGQMTAVERVLEYMHLPVEDNVEEGPAKPPKEWPMKGNIKFDHVFLKYGADDAPVLKDINIDIISGWKVGVVGRTGAGKSSLLSALFRLHNVEGSIKIDGIDTVGLSKKDLRSKISIIPQEPVLFSATLRYNLDPFDTYSDDEIWRALEQVELKDVVPALDFKVAEGGSNFSMGQRQLVCLARAVLRSNKILVMDEATANVDPQTDALIQKTIRRSFASCTVLTIAHRLNTVMDSDRVLVMDRGVAAEFDHPHLLLQNPTSIFSFMVKETGDAMSQVLYDLAKTKYDSRPDK